MPVFIVLEDFCEELKNQGEWEGERPPSSPTFQFGK